MLFRLISIVAMLCAMQAAADAAEPALLRLSFWVAPAQIEDFAKAYSAELAPQLARNGLVEHGKGRATPDSVFSRVFEFDSVAAMAAAPQKLVADAAWREAMANLGMRFGRGDTLRYHIAPYRVPAVPQESYLVGTGRRQGALQVWGLAEGMPFVTVRAIHEDHQGMLWFATEKGIVRFDGQRVEIYGLIGERDFSNWVYGDSRGHLWFGAKGGAARYDGRVFEVYGAADGLCSTSAPSKFVEDGQGNMWFSCWRSQAGDPPVMRYDGQRFEPFDSSNGFSDNYANSLYRDKNGHVWFAFDSWDDLRRWDGERFTVFNVENGLADSRIRIVGEDAAGQMWLVGQRHLLRYDGERFTAVASRDSVGSVHAIEAGADGQLWFGTARGGAVGFDGETFTRLTTESGLGVNTVGTLLADRRGQLWIGTYGGGLGRWDGALFENYSRADGLHDGGATAAEDREGRMWVGTWSGPRRWDGRRFTTMTDSIFRDPNMRDIFRDSAGNLWLGTSGDGAYFYADGAFSPVSCNDEPLERTVLDIAEDRAGRIWLASGWAWNGIYRFEEGRCTHITTEQGLNHNRVLSLLADRRGAMWMGSDIGVSRWDDGGIVHYTAHDGLVAGPVNVLTEDRRGGIWIGTDEGVSRWDGERFVNYTAEQGLVSGAIYAIAEDRRGHMWFGSRGSGVSRWDGKVFQQLSLRDGLVNDIVMDIVEDQEGVVWVVTEGGVTRYRPLDEAPSVYVSGAVADRRYGATEIVRMVTSQGLVRFEYGGGSFSTARDRLVYVYRLAGYEDEWRSTRDDHVEYVDLPGGEYVFEVKAVDRDLNYSAEPAQMRVSIHPPYGLIALWSGLGLALIGLALAGGYGLRKRREQLSAERALMQELEAELNEAHQLQMGLMPTEAPPSAGIDFAGRCLTANHVGGDFYQYFERDGKLSVCLADVTGHAMEAAIPVVMFNVILESQMELALPIDELFVRLNHSLYRLLDARTYVCFAMGEVELATGRLRLCNSGVPYPYHYRASTGEVMELEATAYPLGVRAEADYEVVEATLAAGDRLVFCSDGIVEAEDAAGGLFGFERTMEVVEQGCREDLPADALLERLLGAVAAFCGATPQGDDRTIAVLQIA